MRRNNNMSSSFGKWYEDQKAQEAGDDADGGSWFSSSSEGLPLFNTPEGMQNFSFDSMKQSMEAQMPKKIMGMGYQQRFKVCGINQSTAGKEEFLSPYQTFYVLTLLLEF
jgi:outer membrane protease